MLPKEHRLHLKKDVERVVSSKTGVYDDVCGIKLRKNGLSVSRYAVIAGVKVDKRAVVRNRVRRQYRDIVHRHLSELAPGFDVILLTSKKAIPVDFETKEKKLLHVFAKAKMYGAS